MQIQFMRDIEYIYLNWMLLKSMCRNLIYIRIYSNLHTIKSRLKCIVFYIFQISNIPEKSINSRI